MVHIIGIGSAQGADGAGWAAIDALQRQDLAGRYPAGTVSLHQCRAPAGLYPLLAGSRCAILIDAVPGASGTLQLLTAAQLQNRGEFASVHAIGIGEMLALIEVLEAPPPRVTLLGIGVTPGLSATTPDKLVEPLLPDLSRRIDNSVREYLAISGGDLKT